MAVEVTCPTCGGTGVQVLGMDFSEALALAQEVERTDGWRLYAVEAKYHGPSAATRSFVLQVGHSPTGGTRLEIRSVDDWQKREHLIRSVLASR